MRSIRFWIIFAIAVILGAGVLALIAPSHPVLVSLSVDPTELRPRSYPVMNPFRDRSPERASERYLTELRNGRTTTIEQFLDAGSRERIITSETKWPIRSWRIARRENTALGCELTYWVHRGNGYGDIPEEVSFTIHGAGDHARVVDFGAIY